MLWFNKDKKKKMEFIQNYVPTSKAQLLQVAMYFNKGDIQKAQEMFDFYAKNLDLPDFDPVSPTFMQQVKSNASDIYGWIKENQGDIVQGYQLIYSIIKNKGALPVGEPTGTVVEPLPPING
jgi:UPF0288 family protein (methanogenesis marker protein 3)